MNKILPLLAFAAMTACTVPDFRDMPDFEPLPEPEPIAPVANPSSAKERFIAAAEANGCLVNEQTAPAILSGATLSQEDLARILTELRAEGRGEILPDGTGFRLTSGVCAA